LIDQSVKCIPAEPKVINGAYSKNPQGLKSMGLLRSVGCAWSCNKSVILFKFKQQDEDIFRRCVDMQVLNLVKLATQNHASRDTRYI
jgi:hypothetical protein